MFQAYFTETGLYDFFRENTNYDSYFAPNYSLFRFGYDQLQFDIFVSAVTCIQPH